MPEHILESDNFSLHINLQIFESDIEYPLNSIMTVSVVSNGFSAKTDMDIDIKMFADFSSKLMTVYNTLKGEATIKETYGYEKYISFLADRTGHIIVKGYLCDDLRNNELRFETIFDQTFLKPFASELASMYYKYKSDN